jgi:hypothetical protein
MLSLEQGAAVGWQICVIAQPKLLYGMLAVTCVYRSYGSKADLAITSGASAGTWHAVLLRQSA